MKPFKNLECSISTENHSAGLKNLSNSHKGHWAEDAVAEYLIKKNWKIISRRTKYKFGEIDLIAQSGQKIAIIEVKFLHNDWMAFERIHSTQLLRLKKNLCELSRTQFKDKNGRLFLCFVTKNKKLNWLDVTGD